MPRTLRFMEETDLPQVAVVVSEAFAPRTTACGINWQHDSERLILLVETNVSAAEIGAVYRDVVPPLLSWLEEEFGEFEFEMRALCACGGAAMPMMSGDNPKHDMCLCGECLDREISGLGDRLLNNCPVCDAGFDVADNPGFRVNCSAKFETMADRVDAEMNIDTIGGDMWKWDCCSRECALKQFRAWLSEVESHPVAKEAKS